MMDKELQAFYDPEFYELKIGPGPRVAPVYLPLAEELGGPVLELGCGTGEVILPIARRGIEAWGLDASPRMLGWTREKISLEPSATQALVHPVEGSMEAFSLERRFAQIFLPNDAIAHMLDTENLLRTLACCRQHLVGRGRIAIDITHFNVTYLARFADPLVGAFRYQGKGMLKDGRNVTVWERDSYNNDTGVLTSHFRYEMFDDGDRLQKAFDRTIRLRFRRVEEVVLGLLASGFVDVSTSPLSRGEGDRAYLIRAFAA